MFLHLKKFFASRSLRSDQETKDVRDWLKGLGVNLSDNGVLELVPQCDKFLNLHGNYTEKWFNVRTNTLQHRYFQNIL